MAIGQPISVLCRAAIRRVRIGEW